MHSRSLKGKHVLVTGASGFVGEHFVNALLEQDPEVNIYELRRSPVQSYLPRVQHVLGDITQDRVLSEEVRRELCRTIDEIWHIAGDTNLVNDDPTNEPQLLTTNVAGTRNLLTFARDCSNLRCFNHLSTAYVNGSSDTPVPEESAGSLAWRNPYERSKIFAEHAVLNSVLPWRVFRPSIIVGDSKTGQSDKKGVYAIANSLRAMRDYFVRVSIDPATRRVRILAKPDVLKNLIPVNYVVETLLALRNHDAPTGCLYHITNPTPISLRELFDIVAECLGLGRLDFVSAYGDTTQGTKAERALNRMLLSVYGPYVLGNDPIFTRHNTDHVLALAGRLDLMPPPIDARLFRFLLMSYYNQREVRRAAAG
jgi:nucleoside-diphosphate-sugar epimerase